MANDQSVTTPAADRYSCQVCKEELPIFAEDGKHNFCPHVLEKVGMVSVCIKCKTKLDNERHRLEQSRAPVT